MYTGIKHIHLLCVALSGLGFFLRGLLMLADSPWLTRRWVKVVPHVNDSVLLLAALLLAVFSGQYPFVRGWLTAKLLGLLAYIGLGVIALRPGRPKALRGAAWLAALAVFGWIVSVALTRQPAGYLASLS